MIVGVEIESVSWDHNHVLFRGGLSSVARIWYILHVCKFWLF